MIVFFEGGLFFLMCLKPNLFYNINYFIIAHSLKIKIMENTAQQNLDFIAQMMKSAQKRFYNDSPYYILWGAAVAIASILQYVLLLNNNPNNGIGWAIVIPIAIIV